MKDVDFKKWIVLDPRNLVKSKNFSEIIHFYLFNSPVKGINHHSAKTLQEYGWFKGKISTLKSKMLYDIKLKSRFHICSNINDVEMVLVNNNYYGSDLVFEEFVVCWKSEKNIVDAVLYLIRCAFAHRSFRIESFGNEKYYFLENIDKGKVKGRVIIKESTLLKWIKIIKADK